MFLSVVFVWFVVVFVVYNGFGCCDIPRRLLKKYHFDVETLLACDVVKK